MATEMKATVLVVDDEESILKAMERLLRRDGIEVRCADNGQSALEILGREDIAVLICDQRMPGLSGSEVLEEAYRIRPDTVRITLTGYTDLAGAQAAINRGRIQRLLLKPWDDDHLRTVVRDSVRAYRTVREHHDLEVLTRRQKEQLEAWGRRLEEEVRQRTEELTAQNRQLTGLQRRLEQSLRDTVGIVAGLLEAYSPNLGIHSKRVAELARQVAEALEVSEQEVRDIEFAAYLHDIGKLSRLYASSGQVRSTEPASRSPESDRGAAAPRGQHAEVGFTLLSRVGGFEQVALGIRHQHEWYDGSGGPSGFAGDAIPLASRIIAASNAYDKAVYPRADPTRVARNAGRRVLLEMKGRRFDPRLVRTLLEYVSAFGVEAEQDMEVELSAQHLRPGLVLSRALYNTDSVLLLKAGTELTDELVERIRKMRHGNLLVGGVFVRCEAADAEHRSRLRSLFGRSEGRTAESPADRRKADGDTSALDRPAAPPDRPCAECAGADAASDAPPISGGGTEREWDEEAGTKGSAGRPAAASASIDAARRVALRGATFGSQMRILVVDDSTLICNALKRELRPLGMEVVATNDGWTALQLAQQGRFRAVIVDLKMPAMGGDELVRRLQGVDAGLPCIVLTGNATREHVVRLAQERNVAGILTKPWDHDRLVETLEAAVGHHAGAGVPGDV